MEANQQAAKLLRRTVIIAIAILMTTIGYSYYKINRVQKIFELERGDNAIQKSFETEQIEALIMALKGGKVLKTLVNSQQSISEYPTLTPISTLSNILSKITLKNQIKLRESEGIQSIDFSPDGKMIASGNQDGIVHLWTNEGILIKSFNAEGEVKIWRVNGEELYQVLRTHKNRILSLKFQQNGLKLITANQEGMVRFWQVSPPSSGEIPKLILQKR